MKPLHHNDWTNYIIIYAYCMIHVRGKNNLRQRRICLFIITTQLLAPPPPSTHPHFNIQWFSIYFFPCRYQRVCQSTMSKCATCIDQIAQFTCNCSFGYSGTYCEIGKSNKHFLQPISNCTHAWSIVSLRGIKESVEPQYQTLQANQSAEALFCKPSISPRHFFYRWASDIRSINNLLLKKTETTFVCLFCFFNKASAWRLKSNTIYVFTSNVYVALSLSL